VSNKFSNYDYPKEEKESVDVLNDNIQDPAFITFKDKN
jgi:hypothetical protein